jgi:ankyrin repeat protein
MDPRKKDHKAHKDRKNFTKEKKVTFENATGSFETFQKNEREPKPGSRRNDKVWIKKTLALQQTQAYLDRDSLLDKQRNDLIQNARKDLIREVLAQEFLRLLLNSPTKGILTQPKTRIIESENDYFLISEKMDFNTIKKEKDVVNRIEGGKITGLGSHIVGSGIIADSDRHTDNIGINSEGQMITIDCGSHGFKEDKNHEITVQVIYDWPYISEDSTYTTSNWFGLYNWIAAEGKSKRDEKTSLVNRAQSHDPKIRLEINQTILKFIVLDDKLIEKFVASYTDDETEIEEYSQFFIKRKKQFLDAALQNGDFLAYLSSDQSKEDLQTYIKDLTLFKTTSKNYLLPEAKEAEAKEFYEQTIEKMESVYNAQKNKATEDLIALDNLCSAIQEKKYSVIEHILRENKNNIVSLQKARDLPTPLHLAIDTGDEKIVELLLKQKADCHHFLYKDESAFEYALRKAEKTNDETILNLMMKLGDHSSFIYLTINHGKADLTLSFLTQEKCHQVFYKDQTVFEYAVKKAMETQDWEIVNRILMLNPDIPITNKNKVFFEEAFIYAAAHNELDLVSTLIQKKLNLDYRCFNNGYTPLHYAIQHGEYKMVETMLEKDAPINFQKSLDFPTPLHLAIRNGDEKIVELLVEYNADCFGFFDQGQNAFQLAVSEAARTGNWNIVKIFISKPITEVNRQYFEYALNRATSQHQWDIVSELLSKKLNVDHFDIEGFSALHHAILVHANENDKENEAIICKLIEYFLQMGISPNQQKGPDFQTPLELAITLGDAKILPLLLEHAKDFNKKKALENAIMRYHSKKERVIAMRGQATWERTFKTLPELKTLILLCNHEQFKPAKNTINLLVQFTNQILTTYFSKESSDPIKKRKKKILEDYHKLLQSNDSLYYYFGDERIQECFKNIIGLLLQRTSNPLSPFSTTDSGELAVELLKQEPYISLTNNIILNVSPDKKASSLSYDDLKTFTNDNKKQNKSAFFAQRAEDRFKRLEKDIETIKDIINLGEDRPFMTTPSASREPADHKMVSPPSSPTL